MLFVPFRKILCNNGNLGAVGGCGCHRLSRGFPMRISLASLSSVSLASLALGIAAPSHAAAAAAAQNPTPAPCVQVPAGPEHDKCVADARKAEGETPTKGDTIVVTGTRINRPTLT